MAHRHILQSLDVQRQRLVEDEHSARHAQLHADTPKAEVGDVMQLPHSEHDADESEARNRPRLLTRPSMNFWSISRGCFSTKKM